MSVTCKFSKRVLLIPGSIKYTAKQWAQRLLYYLAIADWGVPRAILSNRDPKFLSKLWKALFDELKVKLLYLTAYHPQTDGFSERTNQSVKIALRFFLHTIKNTTQWPLTFPKI